jgi:hypothetical protein
MSKIIWNEVHDEGGNLSKIVISNRDGGHVYDFLWTPDEPNTPENREEFRSWVSRFLANKGIE